MLERPGRPPRPDHAHHAADPVEPLACDSGHATRHDRSLVSTVGPVQERWRISDQPGGIVEAATLAETIERRVATGTMTTWLESSLGRRIALVSNGPRAMVLLLEHYDGDPGEHAIDSAGGAGSSGGFVLDNGQVDEYADRDTVPMGEALRIVAHLVSDGVPPSDASWQVDR